MDKQLEDAARALLAFVHNGPAPASGDLMPGASDVLSKLDAAVKALDAQRSVEALQAEIVTLKTSVTQANARADGSRLQADMYRFLRDNLHRLILTTEPDLFNDGSVVSRIDIDMRRPPTNPMYTERAIESCMKRIATEAMK